MDLSSTGRRVLAKIGSACLVLAFFLIAPSAEAVPAFARKYQTSCQTCHIVFPKLNAFGEAFRLRGYRMPGETEDMVKQPQTSLGAPAYKRLWPQAVWPGEIPGYAPLAVVVKFGDVNQSTLNPDGSVTSVLNDFQFPQELNLFGAGTLGEHVSFYGEVTFGANPDGSVDVELEHASLGFDSPFGPEDLFHFRIGKFNPNLTDGFSETQIATDSAINALFDYNPIGVNGGIGLGAGDLNPSPIPLPTLTQGVEGYGIIHHRALWVAGVVAGVGPAPGDTTGRFDGNNAKDIYARFDYKIGGLGLDGDTGGTPYAPEKNWRDNSLRLGVFTYRGDANQIPFASTTAQGLDVNIEDAHFLRTGVYASWFIQDLNVFGVYMHGNDALSVLDPATSLVVNALQPTYDAWFAQADYVIYPWLQASGRYETVKPADATVQNLRFGTFNLSALIRANVKAMLEYQRDLQQGQNHSLNALLRVGF